MHAMDSALKSRKKRT